MTVWTGKEEKINGKWYPVNIIWRIAPTIKDANKLLKKGMRKTYGTVEAVRGRWTKEELL